MILSVSRRTDIPAFFTEWFFNRLREGYVLVRNPLNYHQVSRVILNPEVIDCIVFWTKNPLPLVNNLDFLTSYNYYFQITITPYAKAIEPGLPDKQVIIETFGKLSNKIGRTRTIWRYDPIILTDILDMNYHCREFELLASELNGYTSRCIISFVDLYRNSARNMGKMGLKPFDTVMLLEMGEKLGKIAQRYELRIETCSEQVDLSAVGIQHAKCIDNRLVAEIIGKNIVAEKDKNQRNVCGCVASIDIGAYHTCKHGCLYCYANSSPKVVINNLAKHDPNSPMLIGNIEPGDKITERKMESYKNDQLQLF